MELPLHKARGTIASTVPADKVADVARSMTSKGLVFVEIYGVGPPTGFKEPKNQLPRTARARHHSSSSIFTQFSDIRPCVRKNPA